jgi:hypothetical protein
VLEVLAASFIALMMGQYARLKILPFVFKVMFLLEILKSTFDICM